MEGMPTVVAPVYAMYGVRVRVPAPIPWLTPTTDHGRAPDIEIARLDISVQASLDQVSWCAVGMPGQPEPWLLKSTACTPEGLFMELRMQSPRLAAHVRFVIGPDGRRGWCGRRRRWP